MPSHLQATHPCVTIAAAIGNSAGQSTRVAALKRRLADGRLAAGAVVPAIVRAVEKFGSGDYAACAALLEPVAADVVRVGGSHARREMYEDTLFVALMRSGATEKARVLLDARLHRRPSARDQRWRAACTT